MAVKTYVDQSGLQKFAELLKGALYTKTEVDGLLAAINKFDVVVAESLPAASASTMYKIYLISKGGGKTGYTEHITIRSGAEGAYTYSWEEIGDTDIDLSNYVKKEFTIAGIDMQDDITAAELRTALNVADGAQVNVIETVKVNGVALTPDDSKAVDVTFDTTASLTDDDVTAAFNAAFNPTTGE